MNTIFGIHRQDLGYILNSESSASSALSSNQEQMSDYLIINSLSLISLLIAILIPAYLSYKVRNKQVRNLAIILTVFVAVHSAYHLSGLLGYSEIGVSFFNPLSVMILIFFGAYMLTLSKSRTKTPDNSGVNSR